MGDVTYVVETVFASSGSGQLEQATFGAGGHSGFSGKIESVYGAFDRLNSKLQGMGRSMMAPFDAVANKAVDVGVGLGKLGAVTTFGAAAYGVTKLNKELESTQISLAAIFGSQGLTRNMTEGMDLGAKVMRDMRKDAAALPGEFEDLVGIFKTIAIPGYGAGLGTDKLEQMSSKLMATGAVTGLPMEQVAREAAMLMEGRAGAHNVLGMRTMGLGGDKAEAFNKLAPEKRVEAMSAAIEKFAPAIATFSNSFEGLSTTFLDNSKHFLQLATEPLFGKVKDTLREINAWYSENEWYVNSEAQAMGSKFVYWFDVAKEKIIEWWPAIEAFARNAAGAISDLLGQIKPYADEYGPALKKWLANPDAINQIKTGAELYMGTKAAGSMVGTAANLGVGSLGAVLGLSQLSTAFFGGGAAATGAAGVAATGAAPASAAAASAGAGAGATYGTGVAVTAGATTVGAFALALASVGAAIYETVGLYNDGRSAYTQQADAYIDGTNRLIASMEEMDYANLYYQQNLHQATDMHTINMMWDAAAAKEAATAMEQVASAATLVNADLASFGTSLLNAGVMAANAAHLAGADKPKPAAKGHPGGGGGTSVQKVEIVVTSNQDPSRIARMVYGELQGLSRHPKISPNVRNYSAAGT